MSVLKTNFNKEINQFSPVQEDVQRKVKYDQEGNEIIEYVTVDYEKIITENGKVSDWSLNNLLKAGVNPNFPIKTGLNTRLEGVETIKSAASWADELLNTEPTAETN